MTNQLPLPLRARRPSDPEHWEGPQRLREVEQRSGQDETLRYLHWPRKLTVLSGVGLVGGVPTLHVSVSHWGLYEPERPSDSDCSFVLDHFGAPKDVRELDSPNPDKRARDFVWVQAEAKPRKSA